MRAGRRNLESVAFGHGDARVHRFEVLFIARDAWRRPRPGCRRRHRRVTQVAQAAPWTPLFVDAAAVVTNTGGALSHSAIVAREFAIPAVVGTGVSTVEIRDGDLLRVDGTAGEVTILERAS